MPDPGETVIYGAADPLFHDAPGRIRDADRRYRQAVDPAPAGWRRAEQGLWTVLLPDGAAPTGQGWKIHISSIPETAQRVLDAATRVLLARTVPFKFLRSDDALRLVTGKHMTRSGSGKFVTAYPADDAALTTVLEDLVAVLDGLPGPYVLSDLRIGRGPVHVRYGGFVEQWLPGPDGVPVLALRTPSGELVPDERGPVFRLPSWVPVPPVLEPHLAARRETGDDEFPYRFLDALQFSNAGGIYLAEHRDTGERVVLREARPHSGLDGAGDDAVTRLQREHRALTRLQGLPCVPRVYGMRTVWEHHFLVEEHVEGTPLLRAMVERYPVNGRDTSATALAGYAAWVARVTAGLEQAVAAIHARGLCFRDVHPGNVIVRPDDSVVLVDFEYATGVDEPDLPRVGVAGFAAPAGTSGADADRYGVWATWLSMLLPMVEMLERDPSKARTLENAARERFRLPASAGPTRPAVGEIPAAAPDPFADPDRDGIRRLLVAGIHAHATPERDDRLFPADPAVFATGGHTVAHGAAGVLLALHRCGEPVPPHWTDWLEAAAGRARPRAHQGLYDGVWGAATVLDELGRHDAALELLRRARTVGAPARAGVALTLLRAATRTGDDALLGAVERSADQLDALLRDGPADGLLLPGSAGLLDGMSGAAWLHLRLFRLTGDQRRLTAARTALAWELGHCVTMPDGVVQVRDGHRHLLYLEGGSGGIALVAREYLAHVEDAELAGFVAAVRRGCDSDVVREPGLFRGRAGLVAVLGRLGAEDHESATHASIRRLGWHTVHRDGTLLVPGAGLGRFSADLATGAAGVLLALHAVSEEKGDILSLLPTG